MEIKHLQVGPIGTNCYLLCDETQHVCAVIDPGEEAGRIIAAVEAAAYSVCAVLLTHGHYDHTSAAEDVAAHFGCPIYLSRRDQNLPDSRAAAIFPPVAGAKHYDEGDTLSVGDLTVTVLATPGHSQGSVTLRCGDALFCGDTLFAGSCGRTDLPGGSMRTIMASLHRLGALEGNLRIFPGHMENSDLARERRYNPYLMQAMRGAFS